MPIISNFPRGNNYTEVTDEHSGLMNPVDKKKLDGIEDGATNTRIIIKVWTANDIDGDA